MKISGYAAVFNKPSENLGGFYEFIKPGAFAKSLKRGNTFGLYNHLSGLVLGRTSNESLKIWEDETGLAFILEIADTQTGKDVYNLVKRQDVAGMSFGFHLSGPDAEAWFEDADGTIMRELREINLMEISTTPMPAYPQTTVNVGSLRSVPAAPAETPANPGQPIGARRARMMREYLERKHRLREREAKYLA